MHRNPIPYLIASAAMLAGCQQYGGLNAYQQYEVQQAFNKSAAYPAQQKKLSDIKSSKLASGYKKQIDSYFAKILKDPDSRRIEFIRHPYGSLICGSINAKNSYGGYTGKQPFFAYYIGNNLSVSDSYTQKDIGTARSLGSPGDLAHVEYSLLKDCGFD